MKTVTALFIFIIGAAAIGCGGEAVPKTPLQTYKTYTKAIKNKDTTTMKLLLSDATIKMHEQEAKAQNVTLDEIVKRETLFSVEQKTVEFRNEKIDGDKATLDVKNSFDQWETVPFVLEEGNWKIDKKGFADQMILDAEESDKAIDALINEGKPTNDL